ncbi:Ig-like domain-containing protein [Bacteroides sp. AN502(2024)]|uniref:Ig-like domain-containing protein n=1 Tax=Bacteroides sp. AN502(2024) TaxID=3160599 RepID=UPI0035146D91
MRKIFFLLLLSLICISNICAETVYMTVGDTKTLSPTVLPTKVLAGQPAWTSSRPNDVKIVSTTMYSCKIEAVKSFSGYATIHCLYYYRELDPTTGQYIYQRSGYVDYNVFVEETEIKSIEISPTNIALNYGETYRMSVTILPSNAKQNVTWSSSNSSVAFVNSNNILGANGYGTAIVTATASNGLSASCTVTVKKEGSGSENSGDNNGDNAQSSTNYDEVDYYYQISKRRMDALRNKAIQQHNKK